MLKSFRSLIATVTVLAATVVLPFPSTASAATVPGAPTALAVTSTTATSVALSWAAPADTGGAAITGYNVFRNGTKVSTSALTTTGRSFTVSGLASGTSYAFTVAACNSAGCGSLSTAVNGKTAPAAVTGLKATPGSAAVTLTWTDSLSTGVTGYSVFYRASTSATWIEYAPGTPQTSPATVPGLVNGTTYNLMVRTLSDYGSTNSTSVISTPQALPVAPTLPDPADPAIQKLNSTSLILYWTYPASAPRPSYYDVFVNGTKYNTTQVTNTQLAIQNLSSMTAYSFTVKACNLTGCSDASNTYTVTTPPGFPSKLAVQPAAYGATVSWTNSLNATYHTVEYQFKNASGAWSAWTEWTPNNPDTSPTVLTDLLGGTSYNFRVGAWGAGAVSYITTPTPVVVWGPPAQMSQPIVSHPRGEEQTALALTWTAPADGGSSITSYKVYLNGVLAQETSATASGYKITGLSPGTAYTVTLEACNRVACSPLSAPVEDNTAPPAPTGLNIAPNPLSAVVSWTNPTAPVISGYKVFFRKVGVTSWSTGIDGASGMTITGLSPVTSYEVKVASWNLGGLTDSSVSTFTTLAYQRPSKPLSVTATPGKNQVTLSWTKPTYDGDSAITDYEIQFSTDAGAYVAYSDSVSTATSLVVPNLLPTSSYVFQVRAKNVAGTSDWSDPSAASSPFTMPSAPAAPTGTSGASKVTLTWTAPADGGSPITDYLIQVSSNNGATWTAYTGEGASTSTSAEVLGLINGTTYVFRVAAVTAAGTGAYSPQSQGVKPRTLPSAPQNPVGQVADGQVTLSWGTPASTGGENISDYVVQFSTDGTNWTTFADGTSNAFQSVITGLTNGTPYVFQVAAVNSVGQGPWSATSPAYVPRGKPAAPTAVTGVVGDKYVDVSWTPPVLTNGSAVSDYLVQWSSNSGSTWSTFAHPPSPTPALRVTGLTNGSAYIFRVAAVNAAGAGEYSSNSASFTPSTVPGIPTAVRSTPGDSQAQVSWTAPTNTGGNPISDYAVQWSSDGGVTWSTFAHDPSSSTSITVTGLTNGLTYTFRVAAINAAGTGSWSLASTAMILRLPPGTPTNLSATPGNATITVSWTAPASDGGTPITDYVVETSVNGSAWNVFSRPASTATSTVITGLANGTAYLVRVSARNAAGVGTPAQFGTSVTPFTVPPAPTRPSGTPGDAQVTLSWGVPSGTGGSVLTDYVVQFSSDAGVSWTEFQDGIGVSTTVATVTGLTNGTAYLFRVAAVNAAGTGAPSAASASVTPRTVPGAPTGLTGSPGVGSIALAWTAPASNGGNAISDYDIMVSSNGGTIWSPFPHTKSTLTSITVSGLLNGTDYLFKVAARNDAGAGAFTADLGPLNPRTVPGAPTQVTGTFGNTSVTVNWTAPISDGGDPITDYNVQWALSSAPNVWTTFSDGTSTATSATVTGLVNGTSYIFRVRAVNGAGSGVYSNQSLAVIPKTVPAAPSYIATEGLNAAVKLYWGVPANNGGTALIDYVVQFSSDAGATWNTFADGTNLLLTTTVTGLTNGDSYLFRVAGKNSVGDGAWVVTTDPAIPSTVPSSPYNLSAVEARESADLTWTAPVSNGGSSIITYRVDYSTNNGVTWQSFPHDVSTTTSITVTGLAAGVPVRFRVAATNANGDSPNATNPLSATITPFGNPGTPGTPSITACGDQQLSLSWTAPSNSGGKPVTDYMVQISTDGGTTWGEFLDGTSPLTSATLSGLTNGTAYTVRIITVTEAGTSQPSAVSTSCTPSGLPTAPGEPLPTPTDKRVSITWAASDGNGTDITDYVVQFSADFGTNWLTFSDGTSTTTSATVTGLTNGAQYVFRTRAVNKNGQGDWSPVSARAIPFSVPFASAMNAPVAGDAQVDISWSAAADNGSAVTDYEIQYSLNNGGSWSDYADGTSTATSATVTGLQNSKTYVFRVRAINAAGAGAWATKSSSVTPRTVPDPPTNLTATRGNTLAGLTWLAPLDNGGANVTDYTIQWSSDGGTNWNTFADGVGVATTSSVSSLINGTSYVFRVSARNVAGSSAWSVVSSPVTPGTTPSAPATISCVPGNKEAFISWSVPASNGGYAITDYGIKWSKDAGSTWSDFNDGISENTYATMTSLTNGTSYVFRVTAINEIGSSIQSPVSAACRPVSSPDAPDVPTVVKSGDFEVTISWVAPFDNGYDITDYVIQQTTNDGALWTTLTDGVSTDTSLVLQNLSQVLVYRWRVAAKNSIGVGTPSDPTDPVSFATVPAAPTGLFGSFGDTQVQLGWTGPFNGGAAITSYLVELSTNDGATWTATSNFQWDGSSTATTVTGLSNGTTYKFRIAAVNVVGPSAWSSPSPAFTPMRAPTAPSSVGCSPGDASATIGWASLDPDGGGAISDYVVQYSSDNGNTWTTFQDGVSAARTASVTGLTNGTTYKFRVAAQNAAGQGSWSASSSPCLVRTVPSAPAVASISSDTTSATLTFSAPASDGGASITEYTATCTSSNSGTTRYGTSSGSPVAVANLDAGKNYTCSVTATNAAGTGAASNSSSLTAVSGSRTDYACNSGDSPTSVSASSFTCTKPASNPVSTRYRPGSWTDERGVSLSGGVVNSVGEYYCDSNFNWTSASYSTSKNSNPGYPYTETTATDPYGCKNTRTFSKDPSTGKCWSDGAKAASFSNSGQGNCNTTVYKYVNREVKTSQGAFVCGYTGDPWAFFQPFYSHTKDGTRADAWCWRTPDGNGNMRSWDWSVPASYYTSPGTNVTFWNGWSTTVNMPPAPVVKASVASSSSAPAGLAPQGASPLNAASSESIIPAAAVKPASNLDLSRRTTWQKRKFSVTER